MTGDAEPPDAMRTEAEACLWEVAGVNARLRRTRMRAGWAD
jgi:hypothetical protein